MRPDTSPVWSAPSPLLLVLLVCLITNVLPSVAASSSVDQIGNLDTTMDLSDFPAFAREIGLSEQDQQAIETQFGNPQALQVGDITPGLACLTAKLSLGAAQVSFSPVNLTLAGENWSRACVLEPNCIILPRDAKDVSVAIKIIDFFRLKFAVRSGGHAPNRGWSNVGRDGLLLDLQRLNKVDIAGDGKSVSLGPGLRWGEVTSALDARQLTVVGGRNPSVGVGGLILGGGYHYTSQQYGLAADNVKSFEVVLADGRVVEADKSRNSDLFWALKGGGPNFGIVTQYTLYTVPTYNIWFQLVVYDTNKAPAILEAYATWQRNGASDHKSHVLLILGLDSITLGLVYGAPQRAVPSVFTPFLAIEPLQVVVPSTNGTFGDINAISGGIGLRDGLRHDYIGVSSRIDAKLYKDVYQFWMDKSLAVREATGANQTFVLQHVAKNMVLQGKAKGGNPLGLIEENHTWWTSVSDWKDAKDDAAVRSIGSATVAYWTKLARQQGAHIPFLYMNDATREQSPLSTYGTANLKRLRQVAKAYDPRQLFQSQQNGGFLLSDV